MKLLMTTDTVGGVWTYVMELARALEPHGVEIALATMGAHLTREQGDEVFQLSNVRVFESGYKLEWMDDPWNDVTSAGAWLLQIEDRIRPDVIHLNGYAHGSLPWHAPCIVVGHSCVLSWWQAVNGEPAPASWSRYETEVKRGLQAADQVLAPTQAMLRQLQRYYGPLRAADVIFNARDPARFRPGMKEPFIFSAGRLWDQAKNTAALAKVASRLSWPIFVAGEDRHPDHGGQAEHANVRCLGRLAPAAVAQWLSRTSVYALPARYEPFGLSALEAALSCCALVLGDIESLREVWDDAALYVPPDDTDALQQTLVRLISDANLRNGLALRARDRARQYAPRHMAQRYLATYHTVISALQQR